MTEEAIDLVEDWRELSFEQKVAALKASVTVPEVAQLMGIEADEGDKIPSPFNPDERTPSCHLYEDHWYCFATGKGGDIFDLVMAVNPGTELKDAVRSIHQRAVKTGKEYGDVERQTVRQLLDFTDRLVGLEPLDEWMGIDVRGFGLLIDPHTSDVLVPHRQGHPDPRVYGVKVRFRDGGKGSWAGSQYTHRLYDPLGWDGRVPWSRAIICEGESDSWAMIDAIYGCEDDTFDVLALPSGAGSWKDHWLDDLRAYNTIWICMDNDKAGQEARDKLMRKIGYARARELKVPALYNDAREAIKAGWRPFS